jgi:hypothetical protein
MNLSPEQFASVINSLQEPLGGESEKRRARRVLHRARVPIIVDGGTPRERQAVVTVRDLSPRGVGLLHNERLPRGTSFVMRIERAGGPRVQVLCTVAHCRLQRGGVYIIGAEFTCLISTPPPPTADNLERIRRSVLS